ncbi:hypothetical protein [Pelagibius marinus]|uniref:hypothetical protein n=1 Tax=Pelagibius marinus TaxID=2762760 RepID=UPI001872A834|nr:hypothetical protein [Pelagibius marinus]
MKACRETAAPKPRSPNRLGTPPLPAAAMLLAGLLSGAAVPQAVAGEGYKLQINGAEHPIGLDAPKEIVLPDGTKLEIVLTQDEYADYTTENFSFSYKNIYKPSRSDLGSGIFQTAILTPHGTGVMVQEYNDLNPSLLVGIMIKELTKEEVDYGYDYQEREVSRKVGDKVIEGREAITRYQDESWNRTVYAYGERDSGLLIVTFVEKDYAETDAALLEDFWRTLEIY